MAAGCNVRLGLGFVPGLGLGFAWLHGEGNCYRLQGFVGIGCVDLQLQWPLHRSVKLGATVVAMKVSLPRHVVDTTVL